MRKRLCPTCSLIQSFSPSRSVTPMSNKRLHITRTDSASPTTDRNGPYQSEGVRQEFHDLVDHLDQNKQEQCHDHLYITFLAKAADPLCYHYYHQYTQYAGYYTHNTLQQSSFPPPCCPCRQYEHNNNKKYIYFQICSLRSCQ